MWDVKKYAVTDNIFFMDKS